MSGEKVQTIVLEERDESGQITALYSSPKTVGEEALVGVDVHSTFCI